MRHATLNHIYRLVWSDLHQTWVAVSELTRGQGKKVTRKLSAAVVVTASMVAPLAHAGPTGGQITAGSGTINQSGSTTTINQGSQNLSLNWQSFNTSTSETVNFSQPSTSAIAVNRIGDQNPTQFLGKLNANGQVYLINPNGIVFGSGAQVNVGGLVASTLDINDSAASGNARTFSGTGAGSVVNKGTINTANGGYVAFVGKQVQNQGTITAPGGTAALAAGSDVTLSFTGDKLVNLQINKSTVDTLAENGGLVQADGGAVWMSAGARDTVLASVVNNTGIVQARSVQNVNGTIVLEAGSAGTTTNDGTLDVAGVAAGQHGGSAKVLGGTVNLTANSRIDASGDTGGGSALIGGNFKGLGSEQRATNTTVAAGSRIEADARSNGNGGQVAVWSDGATRFDGHISARGGRASGNGGSVETSGKHLTIGSNASVATLAPNGQTGDWLLDPDDFTVYSDGNSTGDIKDTDLTAALQSSNLTIKTGATTTCSAGLTCTGHSGNGDIILANGSLIGGSSWTSGTTLTLSAYRNIELQGTANLDSASATGNMILRSDNTGTGTGTVIFSNQSNVYGNATGTIKIYYNPSSYTSPTDYASLTDGNGNLLINMPDSSKLSSYMYVNLAAVIGNKTYDGSTTASISSATVRGGVPSDVTIDTSGATAAFADKNVGTGKAVTVSGITLSGSGASKYALNGLDSSTATISKRDLSLSGISANNKTYDGTTSATISGSAVVSAIGSDAVSVSGSGAGSIFADKNAGTGKAVTVSGYTLTGADAGNYNLVQPTSLTADIAKANLSVTGVTAANRTYDGTTNATLSGTAAVSALGSDVVTVTGTGSAAFSDKNAGSGKAVTVTGYGLSGVDAGNYNVVQPTGLTATINKASLGVAGVSVADKTYDGTTSATLTGSAAVTGIAGDDVSVTGSGSAVFADKNSGINKAVTVSGYTLGGTDAGNYTLAPSGGLTASIAKLDTVLSGISAANKTYDGTTNATITGSAVVSAIGADVVAVSGSGAGSTFADKNAATGKAITVNGYTLTGADAGNYNLVQPIGLTADIAKANLSVTGVTAANRTYDGTTNATLTGTAAVSALGSDVVTVTGIGNGTFSDKNAGSGKAVTVTGYGLSGADAGNYNVVQPTGLTATINKASLGVAGVSVADKTYDGTTSATLTGTASVTGIAGDDVSVTGSGSAFFGDKNAGVNKAVLVSGYTLGGTDAGNYTLVPSGGLTASIAKLDTILSGISAANKTYDGTVNATITGSAVVSAIGSDAVSVSGSGAGSTFADKNAGMGKAVNVSGYTLTGADAGNYNLVQSTGLSADIFKANLSVTGVAAANKTYDGTTAANLVGTATVAAFGSDAVAVSGSGSASFGEKNVGSGKAVTVSGYTLSGVDAGNYNLLQPSGLTAAIGKASLVLAGLGVSDKVYDGTTAATLSGTGSVSAIGGDVVSVQGSGSAVFADKNAGANKAVNVSGYSLSGADAGNYNLVQPSGLTGTISKADLLLSGLGISNKVYDGTTAATLTGTGSVSAFGSDVVSLAGSGSAAFTDKNAGSGKVATVSGFTLSGTDAGNYNLVRPTGLTANIAKATVSVTGVAAANKTYDGTTAANVVGTATVNAFGSDAVAVSGSGNASFGDKNAGIGKAVTVSGYTLSGADAGNYNLVQPSGLIANISKATLVLAGLGVSDKVYDGTTAATLSGNGSVSAFGGDVVSVTGSGSASFADKNAGANKAVNVSGYSLSGADAGNYNLVQPSGLTASISKADLLLSGLGISNKIYDGTTAATLTGSGSVTAFGSDVVSVAGSGSAAFADKNAGSGKAATVSGLTLSGADAGNYNLVQPTGLTADIAKANLSVTGVAAANKTYDGTTAANIVGTATVSAFGNDAVAVSGSGNASFGDKNAGVGKAVTVSGYSLIGADAGNYNLVQPSGLTANISKASLVLAGLGVSDKVYDGTTAATLSGTGSVSAFGGDVVSVTGSGSASFADKNAGANKAVSVSGYTLSGADAGNYNLVQPSGLTATISKADLLLSGLGISDKVYDGTTAATLTGTGSVSAFGNDMVSVAGSGSASFTDKSVGNGKAVTVGGYVLGGADADNYRLILPSSFTANITPASLTLSGITASDKVFDGTQRANINTGNAVLTGLLGGDAVSLVTSGAFADAAVGNGKLVTLSNGLTGSDSGNYTLNGQTTTLASITAIPAGPTPATPAATLATTGLLQTTQNAVAQVQSAVLPVQAAAQPRALSLSSTLEVRDLQQDNVASNERTGNNGNTAFVNTSIGFGTQAPRLSIQNGGVQLPPVAVSVSQ
ncbi:YDG domain-containing protein [Pseudomonas oryzihabitans]|uniref:Filamentous haemagglutinin FhaB/tRNA nuclease CdiA-like TPS domain-containing protein n=1 Tax=Pseudomonas oryzihabitans TaxID=47885 RepID=A0A2Z5AA12_9PSED|nr:YDG domain-containing protein [Pseudomonas oryzihabitans]AXA66802.1 hypothetical protein CE139_13555 [Pseudomonas oryzihabitans]